MRKLKLFSMLLLLLIGVGQMWGTDYEYQMVTSLSDVTAGTYVVGALRSASATNNFYFGKASVSSGDWEVSANYVTVAASNGVRKFDATNLPTGAVEFEFTGDNTNGFTIKNGSNYLYYTANQSRKLAFASSGSSYKWTVAAKSSPLITGGVVLKRKSGGQASNYTISENATGTGAIRGYNTTTEYRAIYLFKKQEKSSSQEPTLSLNPTSVSVGATDVAQQTIALTASNFSPAVTTVTTGLYSNAGCTSAVTSGAWVKDITVNNAKTQVTFNVDDNTGAARNVWLKITASNGSKSADAILPISQAKYEAPATLPFEYDGNGTGELPAGLSVSGTGTYNSSPAIKFDDTGDYIIIRFNGAPKDLTYDIKGNSFSGGTFKVQTSANGVDYSDIKTYTSLGDKSSEKIESLANSIRYIKFIYTNKSTGNVALGNIVISALPTTATLTYDLNGKTLSSGTKPGDVSNVTLNQAYTLPTSTLGATGYTFVGWNNDKDANSKLTTFTPIAATTYTLYAIWTPNTNTAYTVKHYKQNLDGTYPSSPTETDNLTGTTDASVTPARKSYTGFTAPNGQTVTILPNGSRVVTYNYTRNSYTLTWSLDGGSISSAGTAAGSVKYEASLTAPTVTKTGYTFNAWSPAVPSTMPAANSTYTATWTCKVPNITKDPVSAVYALNDEATPLSVTVEDAGAWCGYQWQSSSDNSNWSNIAAEDGGTSATYTPSTASAGSTTYYRVIVRNITDDCSTFSTSEAATISVSSLPVCATPTFTPSASVAYNSNQTITISCETADVTIYYTVGATPADPTTESTQYDPDHKPVISASATIKAIAVKDSYTTSAVGSATYEFKCVAPTFSPAAGDVATGQEITLNCTTADAAIYYSTDGNNPTIDNEHLYDPENKPVVSEATTIKAIAVKDGWSNSTVASAAYAMIYTVTLNAGTGSVSEEGWTESAGVWTKTQASAGSSIPLPDAALSSSLTTADWSFAGWKTTSAETTQTETKPDFVNKTYTPTSDITLYAVYKKTTGPANYELVEEDLDDAWAGDYLIAYSDEIFADGRKGGKDNVGEIGKAGVKVDPSTNLSGKVVAGSWGDTYNVTLEEILYGETKTNTYVLKTKDGKYNYQTTNSNGLVATETKATAANYPITVTFTSSSDVKLGLGGAAEGAVFRYNANQDGFFRYYKDCGSNPIYLYKKGEGTKSYYSNPSDKVSITYNVNGATAGPDTWTVDNITIASSVTVVEKPETLAKTGYDFGGWNTKDDGTGTNYENGTDHQSFTINENTTLYAKWTKHNYTVAVASVDHTTITATPEGGSAIAESANALVAYETVVTLGKTDDTHFTFDAWDVYATDDNTNKVSVTETAGVYTFTVPDFNVTVSATAPVEDEKVTVTWHVNYNTSTSANVYEGTPFSQLSAPEVADNAVSTCANKFMGWATAPISLDNATSSNVSWADETSVSDSNKDFYAVWATENNSTSTVTFNPTNVENTPETSTGSKIWRHASGVQMQLKGSSSRYTGGTPNTWTMSHSSGSSTVITSPTNITQISARSVYQYESGNKTYTGWIKNATPGTLSPTTFTQADAENYVDQTISNINAKSVTLQDNSSSAGDQARVMSLTITYLTPTYSNYITNCCLPVENALTITNANQVATGSQLTLSSTGGNGGEVVWSVVAGTGTATISEGKLTGGELGTVTLKAHQAEYNNYCAQDAEDMTVTIVAATVPVTGVTLDHTTAALLPGETIQLIATVAPNDATDKTIGWVSGTPATATVSNAGLVTAVTAGTSTVTATANGGDNVTATCAVTVYDLTILKQDETGATISAEGVAASATGKSLSASATAASKYVFKGWKYAENGDGGLDAIANAGNASITLTGTPTGDVTIIAEFYKPVTIAWLVDGEDAAAGSQTLSVARGTLWSALTPAAEPAGNALGSCATAFVGWSNSMNDELRGNGNPAPAVLFRNSQISSYDTEITDPITFRAVFATSAQGSTFDGEHGGTYKIYALIGETKYYAKGTGSKINNTTDVSLATNYTIEVVTDGFAIKTGDNYITYSSSTNLGTSTDPYTWTIASGTKGTWRLNSGTSGRGWIYRAGTTNQFGGYATNNVTAAGTEYYDLEIGSDASYSNYVTVCCTPHSVTVNGNDESENKTVSADVEETCDGMTVNLSRNTSCVHYNFNKWVVKYTDGDEVEHTINVTEDANNSGSFTMPAYNVTVEGDWSPRNYTMTVNAPAAAKGSVSIEGGSVVSDYVRNVAYNSTVTLTATEANPEQYYLKDWTIKNANTDETTTQQGNPLAITMPGYPIEVTANYADVVYSALTLGSAEGVYSLSATLANGDPINDMSSIKSGTALKVTYALSGHNEYVGWTFSVNSVEKSAEGTIVTFNMPEENLNVSLNTRPYYLLDLSAEHGSITSVSIAGEAQELASQYIVHQNELVALTAAPEDNTYKFKEWTGATVTNNQFTVGTSDLDVTAVFELKDTYTLTLMALGSEQEKIEGILEGESIWEQIDDKEAPEITGQLFLGWSLMENEASMIIKEGDDDMPIDDNYPLYAVYQAMTPCYVKVTSTSDIKNGKYLIVYEGTEGNGLAFDGGLETLDAASNTISVEISNSNTIAISEATTAAEFTIASVTGGYSIKSASGKYIGRTGDSNGLNENTETVYTNTLSINNDGNFVCVGSGGAYMRYNSDANQERFRYFKSSTYTSQKAIQLYKRGGVPNPSGETASIPTVTITTPVNADEIYPDGKAGNIVIEDGGSININTEVDLNNITVKDGATVTVGEQLVANDMTVENGGKVEITAGKDLDVKDFYIGGTHGKSGQVTNAKDLDINGNAYFDFTLGVDVSTPEGAAKAEAQWHNFSVPFNVDAINGVYGYKEGEWKKLTNEVDYAIEYYHGDLRANGDYGWKKFRGTMAPGHTYSMTVNGDIQTYRFKKAGNDAFAENPTVEFSQHTSSDSKNAGWNGLGNMRLCYSSISNDNIAETTPQGQSAGRYVLVLDAESYNYVAYLLTNINLTVGSAFFIQASADGNMGFNEAQGGAGKIYAPARTQGKVAEPIMVTMSGERGTDHMYISADEDATSTYQIGRDMQRMFASSNPTTPLIYTMNYGGLKLAAEDAPMVNDQAIYTLQLYAPIAGEYTLSTEAVADADVYLTYEGAIIWNISESEYTVDLNKGKNDGYGLLLRAKAPSVVTGVDQIDAKAGAQKVIIDEHVFILRGGQMYDVNGKMVK